MSGRYCAKHEERAPTGECRWCEPTKAVPEPASTILMWRAQMASGEQAISGPSLQQMMNDLWVKMVREKRIWGE